MLGKLTFRSRMSLEWPQKVCTASAPVGDHHTGLPWDLEQCKGIGYCFYPRTPIQISAFWLFHKQTSQCHRKNTRITTFLLFFSCVGLSLLSQSSNLMSSARPANALNLGAVSPAPEHAFSYLTLSTKK